MPATKKFVMEKSVHLVKAKVEVGVLLTVVPLSFMTAPLSEAHRPIIDAVLAIKPVRSKVVLYV